MYQSINVKNKQTNKQTVRWSHLRISMFNQNTRNQKEKGYTKIKIFALRWFLKLRLDCVSLLKMTCAPLKHCVYVQWEDSEWCVLGENFSATLAVFSSSALSKQLQGKSANDKVNKMHSNFNKHSTSCDSYFWCKYKFQF